MNHGSLKTAALALMLACLLPGTAGAEEPATDGHWLYEVRIVRVDPAAAEASEAGSPFPELEATTIDLSWDTILTRLKQRGRTTVLMDTRLTSLPGEKAAAREESSDPIVALNFQDRNNEQYRSQIVKQGCSFEEQTDERLQYQLQVRGTLTPPRPTQAPVQYLVDWNGTHATLGGRTLVLEHRRQVAVAPRRHGDHGPDGPHELARIRDRMRVAQERLEALGARVVEVERRAQATARRDTHAALQRELTELRAAQAAAEEAMAGLRRRERELQQARPAPARQRAIEHYAFITGRFVPAR